MEREETGTEKRKEGRKAASIEVRIVLVSIVREEILDRVQGVLTAETIRRKIFGLDPGVSILESFQGLTIAHDLVANTLVMRKKEDIMLEKMR
jgi:hypothetical protein